MKQFGLFLIFFVLMIRVSAQVTPYHYTIQAAVSSELIYCATQDDYGRLLIGTDKGLYRYTGFKSTRIAMSGNYSREVSLISRYGNLIFAANKAGQLFQMKGDVLKAVELKDFSGDIRQIAVSAQSVTLTGSKFITKYELPSFKMIAQDPIPFTEAPGTNANSVVKFKGTHYAVLNSGELVEIEEGSSRNIPSSTGKFIVIFNNQLVILPNYVANEPVNSYINGGFKSWGTLLPRSTSRVMNARVIGNQLFVLTENGVFVYTNSMSKKPAHWFLGISTTDIFSDHQGNIWICTKGKGMLFIPAGRHDIVFPGSLLSIEAGPDNTFFGGNLDGSISRFDSKGKELRNYTTNLTNQEALFIYYDAYGKLIFSNMGLFSIFSGAAVNAANESVKGVARDANGGIYMARSSGIVYIPKPKKNTLIYGLTDSTKFSVLLKDPGRSVVIHPRLKDVAMSTVKGVFWKKETGPLTEIAYLDRPIDAQSIAWFRNDLVIATSSNEILVAHDGKIVKRVDLSANIGELVVLKMIATSSFVYILTEKGMYRFADFDTKIESLKELLGFDGLVMRDFTIIDNYLYIATQRGVLRFVWKQEQKVDFTLVVNELYGRKYKKNRQKNDRTIFPADEQMIIIPFECVNLSGNQHFVIQYAIRSGGEGRVWNSLPASAGQLNLSHLSPGDYSIEFRLVDPVSQATSKIQEKKFRLLGRWYNRPALWWFSGILLALTIGATWRWSLIRQKKRLTAAMGR